jgi:hypothetical protein
MQKREAKQFGFDHHDHVIDSFPKKKGPPWQSKCKRDHPFGKKEGKILSRCYFWHRAASLTVYIGAQSVGWKRIAKHGLAV